MDSSSILAAQFIILVVFSVTFLLTAWNNRELSYCNRWAGANMGLALGIGLILAGRIFTLPLPLFYLMVNTALIGGLCLLRNGAAAFHKVSLSPLRSYWGLGLVIAVTLSINIGTSPSQSYIVFNLVALVLSGETLRFYIRGRLDSLRSRWGLVLSFSLLSLSFTIRLSLHLAGQFGLETTTIDAWLMPLHLGLVLIFVSANGAFSLALIFERIAADHKAAAARDPLTGVFNRREFFARLHSLLGNKAHGAFSVILLDLDHFKQINDKLGHSAGDLVLQISTSTMQQNLSGKDCLARIGGEEFAILLPGATYAQAYRCAERIRIAVQNMPLPFASGAVHLTVSAGLYHGTGKGLTPTDILRLADERLYASKNSGRNRISVVQAA
ncbi:GGDEF domain-containing protein [Roseibium suaedae]|uniref:diguanylate cyclase n=1 Tax=Roseibium suaedae TaxID=735517 RepID=A0A1M7GVE0_9HYPH|nr:GGDEF domain-containing protein [Roseibium suaedae]SHM20106.1 diguanylate cyclase (GGDEF) domain-containing protein [Roseibium suaedae]